jgi:hypothetical protein
MSIERPGRESSTDLSAVIGWSYLVAAAYVLARDWPAILLGCVALLHCVYLAAEAGRAGWLISLAPYFRIGRTMASHSAVALSGTILGVLLLCVGGSAGRCARWCRGCSAMPPGSLPPGCSCTGCTRPSG